MAYEFVENINRKAVTRTILDPCEGFIGKPYIDLRERLVAETRFWENQINSAHNSEEFRKIARQQWRKCLDFDVDKHNVFDPLYFT